MRLEDLINDKTNYPDDRKVTLADGIEVTFGELRGGYLRDADYRRKTQALADARRQLDDEKQTTEAALAQAREELVRLAQQANPNPNHATTDDEIDRLLESDPAARRLKAKIDAADRRTAELEGRLKAREEAEAKARQESIVHFHRQTLARIREKDPSLDEQQLIQHAQQYGISRLDIAYDHMNRDKEWENREKQAREDERKKAQEEFRRTQQPVIPLRRTITTPLLGENDPKTFDEAAAAAEKDPEIQALLYGQTG